MSLCKLQLTVSVGYENEQRYIEKSAKYSQEVRFEVARVAILEMLTDANNDTKRMPVVLKGRRKAQLTLLTSDLY